MLKRSIRPEFLNRIDEIIVFNPLTEEEIRQIVRLQMDQVVAMLEKNQVHARYTDEAVALIADQGYDPQFGARPIKRIIQRQVLNEMARTILSGKVSKDRIIVIDGGKDGIVFRNAPVHEKEKAEK